MNRRERSVGVTRSYDVLGLMGSVVRVSHSVAQTSNDMRLVISVVSIVYKTCVRCTQPGKRLRIEMEGGERTKSKTTKR